MFGFLKKNNFKKDFLKNPESFTGSVLQDFLLDSDISLKKGDSLSFEKCVITGHHKLKSNGELLAIISNSVIYEYHKNKIILIKSK